MNLFFFFKKLNFFKINFFLLESFSWLYMFFIKNSKNFVLRKNYTTFINFKKKNNYLYLKYYKFFNFIIKSNIHFKSFNYVYLNKSYKNFDFYTLNNSNINFIKTYLNLITDLTLSNGKFLILDSSYKSVLPLYNYLFNFKNLYAYKNYFLIDPKGFNYKNWILFYSIFLKKFNVHLFLVLNYNHFKKFFKKLKKTNLPILSIIPININDPYVDYPIFFKIHFSSLDNFIFLNITAQFFFSAYNYLNFKKKIIYLEHFYNFSKKIT